MFDFLLGCILGASRLVVRGLLVLVCFLLFVSNSEFENYHLVAGLSLQAIPTSYGNSLFRPSYSRYVDNPEDLSLPRLTAAVAWHQPDTVVLLYDMSYHLPILDSIGRDIGGRPVLRLDAALGYRAGGDGYRISNERVATVLNNSQCLLVGSPAQVAGPVSYHLRAAGYDRHRVMLLIPGPGGVASANYTGYYAPLNSISY